MQEIGQTNSMYLVVPPCPSVPTALFLQSSVPCKRTQVNLVYQVLAVMLVLLACLLFTAEFGQKMSRSPHQVTYKLMK